MLSGTKPPRSDWPGHVHGGWQRARTMGRRCTPQRERTKAPQNSRTWGSPRGTRQNPIVSPAPPGNQKGPRKSAPPYAPMTETRPPLRTARMQSLTISGVSVCRPGGSEAGRRNLGAGWRGGRPASGPHGRGKQHSREARAAGAFTRALPHLQLQGGLDLVDQPLGGSGGKWGGRRWATAGAGQVGPASEGHARAHTQHTTHNNACGPHTHTLAPPPWRSACRPRQCKRRAPCQARLTSSPCGEWLYEGDEGSGAQGRLRAGQRRFPARVWLVV